MWWGAEEWETDEWAEGIAGEEAVVAEDKGGGGGIDKQPGTAPWKNDVEGGLSIREWEEEAETTGEEEEEEVEEEEEEVEEEVEAGVVASTSTSVFLVFACRRFAESE